VETTGLFSSKRFPLGIFHVSFLIILLGAAITRYFSYEGVMHIRENSSADFILSSESYFYAGTEHQQKSKKVFFSEITPKQFSATFNADVKK
jgi:cytochrome c biogenesis protein ResB